MPRFGSQVWAFFDKVGDKLVKCRMCDITLSYVGGSTGSMNNHIRIKHPTSSTSDKNFSQPSLTDFLSRKETKCSPHRAETISQLLAEMVAKDSLPISVVEGSGFGKLINFIEPGYTIPSRKAITARLEAKYKSEKSKLKEELEHQQSVALTTDCWTSRSQEGFMTVTAHYIDDAWSHQSVILDTSPVASLEDGDGVEEPQRHTTEALSKQLHSVTTEWGLTDKVTAVVHDNASNVKNIGELNGTRDVGCAAHTLQLSVTKGLDSSRSIQTTIGAVSRLVGHFRRSNIAIQGLRIKQNTMKCPAHRLIQSCKTRWNSVYDMMERVKEQRWPICAVLSDRTLTKTNEARTLELKDNQWLLVEEMVTSLKPLKMATTCFSYETNTSLSGVHPIISGLLGHLQPSEDDSAAIRTMKQVIRDDLRRRFRCDSFGTGVSMIGSVLDPRYKDLHFLPRLQRGAPHAAVRELLLEMAPAENNKRRKIDQPSHGSAMDFLLSSIACDDGEETSEVSVDAAASSEFDSYLRDSSSHNDCCNWWRENASRFPAVAQLAKKYLCVPATSVPSERVFSSAGNIVTAKRSCLTSEHVNMLVFLCKN